MDNCMGFMLPYIKGNESILDVGSGPGTITLDCAKRFPNCKVTGIDTLKELTEQGTEGAKSQNLTNVQFDIGSATALPYDDDTFDIAYTHQVLLHLENPVEAIKELKRVVKKDGLIFLREADVKSAVIFPEQYEPFKYFFIHYGIGKSTDIAGGRKLRQWALNAGFHPESLTFSCSTHTYSTNEERQSFREMYHERLHKSQEEKDDVYTVKEVEQAWKEWEVDDAAVFIMVVPELILRKRA